MFFMSKMGSLWFGIYFCLIEEIPTFQPAPYTLINKSDIAMIILGVHIHSCYTQNDTTT